MTTDSSPADSLSPSQDSPSVQPPILQTIFIGPKGLRAGWRVLIYFLMFFALRRASFWAFAHISVIRDWLGSQPTDVIAAGPQAFSECIDALLALIPAIILSKIENRPFREYGLPVSEAFGKRFWLGVPFGFVMMSALVVGIAAFHGYSMGGIGSTGGVAVKYALLYAVVFLFTSFFEEFGFRGYLQYTLGSGIGFWPAALALSTLFGAAHLGNPGEAKIGALMAGCFGLLAVFSLQRTGSLWFAVGMHAAFDWTETFFYGVPDSGMQAQGYLLKSTFHGPDWLTGGSVGPEGSYVVFVVLVLSGVAIHFMFPARQKTS